MTNNLNITNNVVQLKSYNSDGIEIGNVYPITNSNAVILDDGKKIQQKINEIDAKNTETDTILQQINEKIEQNFQSVSDGKTLIASAITDKGINASNNDTFQEIADKIIKIGELNEKMISLTYSFENNDSGSGAGIISLKRKNDLYKGTYSIYWANDRNEIIQNYSEICTIDLTISDNENKVMNECYLIPNGVDRLIAVRDTVVETYFTIPENKKLSTNKKYSFGLLSDIHISGDSLNDKAESVSDLNRAMDYFQNVENTEMVIISGDITQSGLMSDMQKFREIVDSYTIPVHCCRGNHDTYNDCTIENYTKYIDSNGLYYEMIYKDDIYLFLGLAMEDIANPFPDYGLDWLEQKLETYKNKRVFLIQHIFIEPTGNPGNLYMFNEGLLNTEGTNAKRFIQLMKKYRNVIFFSGHSHFDFSLERLNPRANVSKRTDSLCHRVHTPSGSRPRQADGDNPTSSDVYTNYAGSQGYVVDVYDDYIVLKGFDFPTMSYVINAQYCINTTPIIIGEESIATEYEYESNFTTFEYGALEKTGDVKAHTVTRVSDYIRLNDNPDIGFQCKGKVIYVRICYYDINKTFISYENFFYNDVASAYHEQFNINKPSNAYYMRFCGQEKVESMMFNGVYKEEKFIPNNPPIVDMPINQEFPKYATTVEPEDVYQKAKWKSLEFIKRQLNTSEFKSVVSFNDITFQNEVTRSGQTEPTIYSTKLLCGTINSLENPCILFNKYISLDDLYDEQYSGFVSGKWYNSLKFPENYRVDVYVITDRIYYVDSCKLNKDNTWRTNRVATRGIKHIELVEINSGLIVEYGNPIIDNYKVEVYNYVDVEYLYDTCNIFLYNGEYYFFSDKGNFDGKILGKVINNKNNVVGISSKYSNILHGRLPSSYLIPSDDPNYDKEGSSALGQHAYLMNSRSFIYDVGLALLVFTSEGQYDICKELINRIAFEQKEDGSFNFSYDNYIGQLYEDYIRTGSIGWLIWGICFYTLKSGDESYIDLLKKSGEWILSKQIKTVDDSRYGLLLGGKGSYNADYSYNDVDITWCSTEHNCSTLQAVNGLYKVLKDERYNECASLMKTSLIDKLYDSENDRFYQGITVDGVDEAWSIDCLSWAGKVAYSIGRQDIAEKCANKILEKFLVENTTIVTSSEKENYNLKYSLDEGVLVSGFKPYADGYDNNPSLVWTEGTLGVVSLLKALNRNEEAKKYLDEMIKLQNCNSSTGGLIYTTETRSSYPWEFHVWESVVSSAWLYLVLSDEDVLLN